MKGFGSIRAGTEHITSQAYDFLYLVLVVLVIYMLLGVALVVLKVVAKPLLLLQKKPPPEAHKSPNPPKLAIKSYMLGELYARSRS